MAETGNNIFRVYDTWEYWLSYYDPGFFFIADMIIAEDDYIIPTSIGQINQSSIVQSDLIASLTLFEDAYNNYDMYILGSLFTALNWISTGDWLWGIRYDNHRDTVLSGALVFSYVPKIGTDSMGNRYFIHLSDEPEGLFDTITWSIEKGILRIGFFLDIDYYGYHAVTMFGFDKIQPETIEFDKLFSLGEGYGWLGPGISYYDHLQRLELGMLYEELILFDILSLSAECFFDIYNKKLTIDFSSFVFEATLYLFKQNAYDFHIVLKAGLSFARIFSDDISFGFHTDVCIENIFYAYSLLFGVSCNYKNDFFRLPLRDKIKLNFGVKAIFIQSYLEETI